MHWNRAIKRSRILSVIASAIVSLFLGCSKGHSVPQLGPAPTVRVDLSSQGLPKGFFSVKDETPRTVIRYRFVIWPNSDDVVIGFSTIPAPGTADDRTVDGSARLLAFGVDGELKAKRDIPYLAYGYGEIVAEGEATAGPHGSVLFRIQSVNLDKSGTNESKPGVLLLDSALHDTARIDRFLEQTTFVDHALVFQKGFTLGESRTYDVLDGSPPSQTKPWQQDWPIDARDRKFGENGLAYMSCQQELRPNEYVSTGVVYGGAKQRCALVAEDRDRSIWKVPLKDGETATIVGLLADGGVVGHVSGADKGDRAGQLVIWRKDKAVELLPWIPPQDCGSVESGTPDMSRYAAFACDDRTDNRRWMVFDQKSPTPLVNRPFPRNGRAALSPDGLHYASFESGELRIYSLPKFR